MLIWRSLRALGITPLLQRTARGLRILTYHSFSAGASSGALESQSIDCLRTQLQYLRDQFEVVSLGKGLAGLSTPSNTRCRDQVVLTVDDGYADNYHLLYPVLLDFGIPATIFLSTDYLDTGRLPWPVRIGEILLSTQRSRLSNPFKASLNTLKERQMVRAELKRRLQTCPPTFRFDTIEQVAAELHVPRPTNHRALTWEQVRHMSSSGLIEFGSHTVYHSFLTAMPKSGALAELSESKSRIEEETGRPCRYFSYPNGNFDSESAAWVRDAGYEAGLTQRLDINRPGQSAFALARIHLPPDDPIDTFALRVGAPLLMNTLISVRNRAHKSLKTVQ